jgi:DNA-binding protein H-NS
MATPNLSNMSVEQLMGLRNQVDARLSQWRTELEEQLGRIGGARPDGRRSALKGLKVPPKYRGPDGETWAGRGVTPRWLKALLKQGHKIQEFAVDKTAVKKRSIAKATKRVVKRSSRKRK